MLKAVRVLPISRALLGDTVGLEGRARQVLYHGALGVLAVQIAGAGLGLLVHVVVARLLGAAGYGAYSLTLAWVSVLLILALAGQGTAVVRLVPRYMLAGSWGELRGLRKRTRMIALVASLIISAAGGLTVHVLADRLGSQLKLTLLVGFILLPVLAQLQLSGAFHRGLKRAVSSQAFNNLLRPIALLGILAVYVAFFHRHLTPPLAVLASCLGAMLALGGSEALLAHVWPRRSAEATPRYRTSMWLTLGRRLFLFDAIGVLLTRIDVLVLGAIRGASEVGPYYAAVQLAYLAIYGLNAVNTILAPLIAERYSARDGVGLAALVRHAAWLTFVVTCIASLAVTLAAKWVFGLFGPGFSTAYLPLLVILAGQCINAAAGPIDTLMTMTRFERQAPIIFGAGAVLNLMLSLLLVPRLGMLGAAIAAALSTLLWNVLGYVFVRSRLGVNPTILPLRAG